MRRLVKVTFMQQDLLSVEEVVSHDDTNEHRFYPFVMPADATSLHLSFEVAPRQVGSYDQAIGVYLHDPSGFRGSPGRTDAPPRLGVGSATPGFVPGPLTPGTWQAEVSLGYVLGGSPCTYRLHVWLDDDPDVGMLPSPCSLPLAIPNLGPGWYAGDLHMHTHHSDGRWSAADLWRAVRERNLDFFVLTDHNTLAGHAEVAALAGGDTLPIPGIEVTTLHGHLLALGVETWIDWRVGWNGRTIDDVVRDVHANGGVAIIAHPAAGASPGCHGCRWDLLDVDMRAIDGVEAWNNGWPVDDDNERNLLMYDGWLGRGFRVPITGGSDDHGDLPSFVPGAPTTYVYATELSRAGILDGIRAGHTMVSSGPAMRASASAGSTAGLPGDTLPAGEPLRIDARVTHVTVPASLRIVGSAGPLAAATIDGEGACYYAADKAAAGWYRAELRAVHRQEMLAVTSPFFVR